MVLRTASHLVSSQQTKDPEYFADSSSIPRNPPTNLYPDLIAQKSHVFLIGVVLTYNDSRIIPRKTCHILRNCQCKWLWVSLSAPGTSVGSSGFPEKFLFCTGWIETTEWPNLVPQQRIDDSVVIHILHWELCDLRLLNHQNSPLWARLYQYVFCKKPLWFSTSSRCHNFVFFGKCVYTLCLPEFGSTLARGCIGNSWEELEVSWTLARFLRGSKRTTFIDQNFSALLQPVRQVMQ